MAKDPISDVFSTLDKLNPEATYLSENALSNVDTWYDTAVSYTHLRAHET